MRTVTTRIMSVDTGTYAIYRSTTESARVGTKHAYIVQGNVTGQLSPVRDSTSLEIYGNRVTGMYNLTYSDKTALELNDRVQIGGDYYKVIAVTVFTGHAQATLERVGVI